MNNTASNDNYLANHSQLFNQSAGHNQPWLTNLRQQAFAYFTTHGFPNTQQEDWKYTSVAAIAQQTFKPANKKSDTTQLDLIQLRATQQTSANLLVFIDGYYAAELSQTMHLPTSSIVGSITEILAQKPDHLAHDLGHYAKPTLHGFAALNLAAFQDGAFIEIPANTQVDAPIELLFITTQQADATSQQLRNFISVGENSKLQVIEHYLSLGSSHYFTNAITEIILKPHAQLDYYKIQAESHSAFHIATTQVQQQQGSRFTSYAFSLGAALARTDINSDLTAPGSECELNGLYLAEKQQHTDQHTCINHQQPHTTSREFYRGILSDTARAVFNGKIIVQPMAQFSNAQQNNNNLLLTTGAEIDTKPQLEIYNDDVKCTHGATVGRLDEQALFYLQSRGIDAATAYSLLVYAFANDVLNHVPLTTVREHLQSQLLKRLPAGQLVREML